MIGWFHRWQSELVDAAAFAGIGLWQLLGRAGRHGPQEWEEYATHWLKKGPADFYRVPESLPGVLAPGRQKFPSPVSCDREENNLVHLRVWPGREGLKSPAMILLHSLFSASDVGYVHWASVLNRLGWTAIFYDLPYHYRRRPKGTWSGELVFGGNLIRSAETIRQAVADTRMVARMARAAGASRVGLWGMSLGGWVASLAICHEPDLACAWLVQPIPDVATAIWDSPGGWVIRRQMEARGLSREQASRMLPMVCPSSGKPKLAPEKILLVGGTHDRIARPGQMRALARDWGGAHYREVGQGHIGYQAMPMTWRWGRELMPDLFDLEG
jgi:pimeloyl-ACP methyl ester carboxylesterase